MTDASFVTHWNLLQSIVDTYKRHLRKNALIKDCKINIQAHVFFSK